MGNNTFQEEVFSKGFNMALWRKMLKYAKPYKNKLIVLSLFMAMLAGFDAVIPLMQRYAIDNFIVMGSTTGTTIFFIGYAVIILIQTLLIKAMISYAGHVETSPSCVPF